MNIDYEQILLTLPKTVITELFDVSSIALMSAESD